MGTMSKYTRHRTRAGVQKAHSPKLTINQALRCRKAQRELGGHMLADVLTVIRHSSSFNRPTRKLVFSLFRRHCRARRTDMLTEMKRFEGEVINQDSVALVQGRLLTWAGII